MKLAVIFGTMLLSLAFGVIGVYLLLQHRNGWGWFVLLSALTVLPSTHMAYRYVTRDDK